MGVRPESRIDWVTSSEMPARSPVMRGDGDFAAEANSTDHERKRKPGRRLIGEGEMGEDAANSTGTQSIQRSCSASRRRAEASMKADTSPLRAGAPPSSSPKTRMADAPNRQGKPLCQPLPRIHPYATSRAPTPYPRGGTPRTRPATPMSEKVITRFAPSPTGYLHIGGARTALFNWLYARAKGGKMLLRIEDTDRARSTEGAILAILDGLRWLEIDWHGEPVYQLSRAERHREVALELLAQGKAYRCYATPEDLEAMRELARKEGRSPSYDGIWRDRDAKEAPEGVSPAIRFRAPNEGETVIEDQVQGSVTFANKDLDDLVILRSDGTPTYNLSVVVDDH